MRRHHSFGRKSTLTHTNKNKIKSIFGELWGKKRTFLFFYWGGTTQRRWVWGEKFQRGTTGASLCETEIHIDISREVHVWSGAMCHASPVPGDGSRGGHIYSTIHDAVEPGLSQSTGLAIPPCNPRILFVISPRLDRRCHPSTQRMPVTPLLSSEWCFFYIKLPSSAIDGAHDKSWIPKQGENIEMYSWHAWRVVTLCFLWFHSARLKAS